METWQDKEAFKARVQEWARKMDIIIHSITMRKMKSKWASCSTNGNMTFNTELLELSRRIGDYVIVHELLHFRAPNHGRLWKSLMRGYLGEYEVVERELKAIYSQRVKKTKE